MHTNTHRDIHREKTTCSVECLYSEMENTEGGSVVDMTLYFFMLLWGMNLPLKSSKKYTVFIFLFWSTMRTLMFNICSVLVCFLFSPLICTGNFVLNIWRSFFSCFFFNFSGLPEFLFYGCQLVQPSSTDLEPSRPVRIGNKWIFSLNFWAEMVSSLMPWK